MIGILCEKPSAARNFAKALGGFSGTYNGESFTIVASHGHLYGLDDEPGNQVNQSLKARYQNWNLDNLPWNEEDFNWVYTVKDKSDETPQKIASVLNRCSEICIATDDDPTGEGELLAWEILWMNNINSGKYTRMYFADEAPSSIQKAFRERKTLGNNLNCMYDDADYKQAIFRTKWDYLSMQWSRIATKINNMPEQVLRNGRLKSAMIVLVGDQLKLVSEYVKKPFYQNRFTDEKGVVYKSEKEQKYDSKSSVPQNYHSSSVTVDSKEQKESTPPRFLDLASLSSMLAPKGIPAKTTLATYQKMYEDGIVSYPRTEDHYITEEQFYQLLPLVNQIASVIGVDASVLTHRMPRRTHIKEGMAHGANRPGLTVPDDLNDLDSIYGRGAKLIYTTLARNYLATIAENYVYEQQKGHVTDYPDFTGTADIPVSLGWEAVFDEEFDEEAEEMNKGLGKKAEPFIYEGANPKPAAPTMKWLMKQLEKRSVGTGATRTSTYSDITNEKTKYPLLVDRKGKITFADCGEANYKLLGGTHIADLTMTEHVMQQMKQVASGTGDPNEFLHEIQQMVIDDIVTMKKNYSLTDHPAVQAQAKEKASGIWQGKEISFTREWSGHRFTDEEVNRLLNSEEVTFQIEHKGALMNITGRLDNCEYKGHKYIGFTRTGVSIAGYTGQQTDMKCPRCGKPIVTSPKAYSCSDKNCGWMLWKENKFAQTIGFNMTDARVRQMIENGKYLAKGLTSKTGKKYDAYVKLKDDGRYVGLELDFPNSSGTRESLGNCPFCGKPVYENDKAYGCSGWRDGCKFTIWKNTYGKKIPPEMVKQLLENGESEPAAGFHEYSKMAKKFSGKSFKGKLVIEENSVTVKKV